MDEQSKADNATLPDRSRAPEKRSPYHPPTLVEYGPVAKLVQGALTSQAESGGFKMACL